jgi:hypothetical protein
MGVLHLFHSTGWNKQFLSFSFESALDFSIFPIFTQKLSLLLIFEEIRANIPFWTNLYFLDCSYFCFDSLISLHPHCEHSILILSGSVRSLDSWASKTVLWEMSQDSLLILRFSFALSVK